MIFRHNVIHLIKNVKAIIHNNNVIEKLLL